MNEPIASGAVFKKLGGVFMPIPVSFKRFGTKRKSHKRRRHRRRSKRRKNV